MYININGIELFYEMKGSGSPIILLHGNGEDHTIFNVLIEQLSEKYTVYALDSRDHGKSSKTNAISYDLMMEDVAGFINVLKIDQPALYGFSDGGIVGILLALKYPDLLSRLAISGVNIRPDGIKLKYLVGIRISYFFKRDKKLLMMLTQPNIKNSYLKGIAVPTLMLAGSNDLIKEDHTKMIASNIPNSILLILKGEGHASYVVSSKKLYEILEPFLQGYLYGQPPEDR